MTRRLRATNVKYATAVSVHDFLGFWNRPQYYSKRSFRNKDFIVFEQNVYYLLCSTIEICDYGMKYRVVDRTTP